MCAIRLDSTTTINDSGGGTTYCNVSCQGIREDQCEALGGHCYGMVLTGPPVEMRECKHCRKSQLRSQQSDMVWRDA